MIDKWKEIINMVCSISDKCVFKYFYLVQTKRFIDELKSVYSDVMFNGMRHTNNSEIIRIWCKMLVFYIPKVNEDECLELMKKKRMMYSNKPLEITGQVGLVVRQIAKLCRLVNVYDRNLHAGSDEMAETVQDTVNDIFNYCIIGVEMAQDNQINVEEILKEMINECE